MKSKNLTHISLKDLPDDGRDFEFSRASGELNHVLKDVVGQHDYRLRLHIKPMGNTYDVKGELHTEFDLQCSLCANEFPFPVHIKINELLLVEKALGKGDQGSKVNHAHEWASDGPDYIILPNDVFNIGEYAHEAIALSEPIRPLCSPQDPQGCKHPEHIDRPWLSYGESAGPELKENPFRALEKLKLKS